jgi:hypothetical protein
MAERPETGTQSSTAAYIRGLAAQHHVTYVQTESDLLAQHMTRSYYGDSALNWF